jgi:predicted ribosomally synthesized peptide with nif11-like leader
MSKENLERFMTQAADSEELQARIGEEIDAETLIALGAEHGCEFSADDLTAGAELSDEELDGVAGGSAFVKLGDRRSPQVFSEDDPISLQEACANGTFFKVKVRRS